MSVVFKKIVYIISAFLMFILVGCTPMIETPCDELVASKWSVRLENNNVIKLCFKDDSACMKVEFSDDEKLCISGFCEVSDSEFIIYDKTTRFPYIFEYIVHFDRVEVKYLGNTVSLYKS